MTKHSVNDKVKVRTDLVNGKFYGMEDGSYKDMFVFPMSLLKGKEVTIAKVITSNDQKYYKILEDDELWYWTDEMFEG